MKRKFWETTIIIVVVLLALTLICTMPVVNAAQYGTNFKFKDLDAMKEDGWSISHPEGVTLRSDGIVLDGSQGVTTIAYSQGIPSGINDWKVGAIGAWLGGNGHSWLNVHVYTQLHTYVYALDGGTAQFVLLRDNVKVIGVEGYQEAVNSSVEIHMEKMGSTITLSFNSKVIKTYTETDPSPVICVAIASPSQSAALYTWAGAFVPESSSANPVGGTDIDTNPSIDTDLPELNTEPAEPDPNNISWMDYDTGNTSDIILESDDISGLQDNPGYLFDFSTIEPGGQIPVPPLPPNDDGQTDDQDTNSNPNIWIVLLDGTFSINTDKPQLDDTISFVAGNCIFNGVGQEQNVYVGDGTAQVQAAIRHEQHLFESGAINPTTPIDYNQWGGDTPSFYVTGSTHISGDLNNPLASQSAVAIFTFTVTGANGQVVYQKTINAVASAGKSLYDYWLQGSQDINTYLQSVVNSMKNQ